MSGHYPSQLKRHVGNPVSDEFFWPRPDIIDPLLASIVERKESRRMFGLRRIGKSSILKECARLLEKRGFIIVQVDAEGFGGVDQLFTGLLNALRDQTLKARVLDMFARNQALPKKLMESVQNLLSRGAVPADKNFGKDVRDYWSLLSATISEAVANSEKPVVLLLDELTFMLKNMRENGATVQDIRSLLAELRAWRQHGLIMVLTGSIGLTGFMSDHKLSSTLVNDMIEIPVTPLTRDEAQAMVEALLNSNPIAWWTPEITTAVLDRLIVFYPFLIQVALNQVEAQRAMTEAAIDQVFQDKIEPDFYRSFYQQFSDRYKRHREAKSLGVEDVLGAMFGAPEQRLFVDTAHQIIAAGATDIDPDDILSALSEDGFISVNHFKDTLEPSSPLFNIWWQRYARRRRS